MPYPYPTGILVFPFLLPANLWKLRASPYLRLREDSFMPTIYIEASASQEADQGHPELPGYVHSEAARGGDGAHDGHPGGQALLQNLETAAPADHHHVIREREPPL